MKPEIITALNKIAPNRVRLDQPLASLTTFRLGGPASALVEPESREELSKVLALARADNLPVFILGGGSNVLFKDGGFPGIVIRLGQGLAGIEEIAGAGEGKIRIRVGAAERTAALTRFCINKGFSGLEFLAGIPGRVGGALAMNAGARGREISESLVEMEIMTAEGGTDVLPATDMASAYRCMRLPEGSVILSGTFELSRTSEADVKKTVSENLSRRMAGQPRGVHNAGCVFKNPAGDSAGRLIDQAGLKGLRVGRAYVAREHANFIVHRGGAASWEVIRLMETIQDEIRTRFQVELEPEIKIIGVNGQ